MVIGSFGILRQQMPRRPPLHLAVASGDHASAMSGVFVSFQARRIADVVITCNVNVFTTMMPDSFTDSVTLPSTDIPEACVITAIAGVRGRRANVLTKGCDDRSAYLRSIVDPETVLYGSGALSNLTFAEMPLVPKPVGATDGGILPLPTFEQKRVTILDTGPLFRGLGLVEIRVTAITATEEVSSRQPATIDAQMLAEDCCGELFPGFVIDALFGYDVALCHEVTAANVLARSTVAGAANFILFPTSNWEMRPLKSGSCTAMSEREVS